MLVVSDDLHLSEAGNRLAVGVGSGMELAQGTVLPAGLWSNRSRARVVFLLGEQRAAERVVQRLFGRALQAHEYAGLAGASDDAQVEVGASDGELYIELRDPVSATCGYYYLRRTKSAVVLRNEGFCIGLQAMRRQGLGLQMFYRQARNAALLGVDRIETIAGRKNDENGYYAWPRYGFQGRLPASVRHLLPLGWDDAQTVLDLMWFEEGRDWWREHGETIPVRFDLTYRSRSRRVLMRYVRERILTCS